MIEFKVYTNVEQIPDEWNELAAHDIFLQKPYFQALAKASPKNISWYFLGVFMDHKLTGVAVIQRVELYLEDIFRNYKDSCYRQKFKHFVSKFLKGNMLVVGNLMHTGQHGIYFDSNKIFYKEFLQIVNDGISQLEEVIRKQHKKRIRIIMFKDYFLEDPIHAETSFFESLKFHKVSVQPNMIMKVANQWQSFENYLTDLNKKYRQRYKVARKKSADIARKELSLEDLEQHSNQIYELYKTVSDNAKINTFILPPNHVYQLKKELENDFKVFGYYHNSDLIGFYTLILNKTVLETYFLGYDEKHQYANQLYLNMLYDMAEFGIENNFDSIVYARTAMEIKSSVGAKPYEMNVYLKHSNVLMNTFLKYIFKLMNPSQDWEERHPFKS